MSHYLTYHHMPPKEITYSGVMLVQAKDQLTSLLLSTVPLVTRSIALNINRYLLVFYNISVIHAEL